jgi:hypothetical protein
MGRMYTATFDLTAVTAAIFDFFEFTPADDKPIILHAVYIGQTTEIADAQEEQMEWTIRRGGTGMSSGSGGIAAANGVGLDPSYAASGFTFEAMNTTEATFTAGVEVHHDSFNVRTGLQYIPTPEMRTQCSQLNGGFVVRCESTPVDSISFVGTAYIEELG